MREGCSNLVNVLGEGPVSRSCVLIFTLPDGERVGWWEGGRWGKEGGSKLVKVVGEETVSYI